MFVRSSVSYLMIKTMFLAWLTSDYWQGSLLLYNSLAEPALFSVQGCVDYSVKMVGDKLTLYLGFIRNLFNKN